MQHADLLIEAGVAVTMDAQRRMIRDAAVAVVGDRIAAVGKTKEVKAAFSSSRIIDARNKVVLPGLVNAHLHFYHQLHRGLAPDWLDGHEWSNYVHGKFAPHITPEAERWAALATLIETLRSGATTFLAAGSYHPSLVLEAIGAVGLRGFEGRRTFDRAILGHSWLADDTETCLRGNERVMSEFAGGRADGRVRPCVDIVGLGRCSDELLVKSKELADRTGALLNLHECAFIQQVEEVKRRTGLTPIAHLERLGVLGPSVVLVHMIHVTDEEIAILKRHDAKVVHCPTTALKLTYGLSRAGRFPEMLEAGVTVAIGSDCGDCSNYNDMIRVMYLAAVLFKDARFNARIMGAETALEMATLAGARALGLENEIGSLEPGKKADIVLVATRRADWVPVHHEIYNLVYAASASSVDTVLVDGRVILEAGRVLTVDEEEVLARTQEHAVAVRRAAGLEPSYKWPVL